MDKNESRRGLASPTASERGDITSPSENSVQTPEAENKRGVVGISHAPWRVEPDWAEASFRIRGKNGENIADVYGKDYAHLIAAAPDLLEACRRAFKYFYLDDWGLETTLAVYKGEEARRIPVLLILIPVLEEATGKDIKQLVEEGYFA
jgi:hypothetical protein